MAGENEVRRTMFGAGCFWGVQYYFDQVPGVTQTTVGYSGGHSENPDYYQVHDNNTGHAEVVLIEFDPERVSYETLVRHFFRLHNPTLINSDGINFGSNYRSCAFYFSEAQKQVLERVRDQVQSMYSDPIVTEIAPAKKFWEAEPFHQKFTERTGRGTCHVPYEALEGEVTAPPEHTTTMAKMRSWLRANSR